MNVDLTATLGALEQAPGRAVEGRREAVARDHQARAAVGAEVDPTPPERRAQPPVSIVMHSPTPEASTSVRVS
jgi:hypothetical protein